MRICGYNTKEIARLLNMKEEAVRYRVRKLKRKLKKII
ncbi:sigma factor-like helix-turn-helix DNA-binding protein [Thomasclavelia ramosa]